MLFPEPPRNLILFLLWPVGWCLTADEGLEENGLLHLDAVLHAAQASRVPSSIRAVRMVPGSQAPGSSPPGTRVATRNP
jgi:hypothetical protein